MRAFAKRVGAVLAIAAACAVVPANAARDAQAALPPRAEILVFEREACAYCVRFRDEIATRYRGSPAAFDVPMRFVDVDHAEPAALGLKSRLTMLPTAVLIHEGREVDRIAGYTGPETFFTLVKHLIDRLP